MSVERQSGEIFDSFWDLSSRYADESKKVPSAGQAVDKAGRGSETCLADAAAPPPNDAAPPKIVLREVDEPVRRTGTSASSFTLATEEEISCYAPEEGGMITYVKLYRRPNTYSFYRNFRTLATQWFPLHGHPCDPVPFFSYVPQYAQMTSAQKNYYLFWRDQVLAGSFPKCDISYLWLHIYEIINLPDLIPPEQGVIRLAELWKGYRTTFPKIDKYMTVWLADYCLVHRLRCPDALLRSFLPAILANSGFREFFLGRVSELDEYGVLSVLSEVSSYHWQSSKFMMGKPPEVQSLLLRSLVPVVRSACEEGMISLGTEKVSVLSRDAFSGSLCAHNVKCRIEVGYHSFSHAPALTQMLTCAVKYAENKVRAMCGQKSRLTVGEGLMPAHAQMIDAFFGAMPSPARDARTARDLPTPEYEKYYDAPDRGFCPETAEKIESLSWDNTRLLVVDEADQEREPTGPSVELTSPPPLGPAEEAEEVPSPRGGAHAEVAAFLQKLLDAEELPATPENRRLCEEANLIFTDLIGDIAVEADDRFCRPVQDYREEIEEWIRQ